MRAPRVALVRRAAVVVCGLALALPALADMSPVGTWQTVDEGDHAQRAEIVITDAGGELRGRITRMLPLDPEAAAKCGDCSKGWDGKPLVGTEVISGVHKAAGQALWDGGKVLDPDTGKSYDVQLTLADGGSELLVRAFQGPFFETQTWKRVR